MATEMLFRQLFDYETWTYTYLIAEPRSRQAVLVDTVKEKVERDLRLLQQLDLKLSYILDTHVHADHVTGAWDLKQKTGARSGINKTAGVSTADIALEDGSELMLGSVKIRAIATPGHTNTCMSFYVHDRVLTGDALLIRDVGRTDFQQGSNELLYESVTQKLFSLPDQTLVYPGHDYNGFTKSSIAEEKAFNLKMGNGASFAEFVSRMQAMKLGLPKRIHIAVPANLTGGRDIPQGTTNA